MRLTLTFRGDYAVRAMLALAEHSLRQRVDGSSGSRPALMSASTIAATMRIPERFLAHVLSDLVKAGLAQGTAGRRGGYRLARPAHEIRLLEVVDAAEPSDGPARCVLRGVPCDPSGRCAAHDAFAAATAAMRTELARTTLESLVGHPGA